jgi:hypothetical protein
MPGLEVRSASRERGALQKDEQGERATASLISSL